MHAPWWIGGLLAVVAMPGQAPVWRTLTTTPDPRLIAWDARLQRVVMSGGGYEPWLWEWDGAVARPRLLAMPATPSIDVLLADPAQGELLALTFATSMVGSWRGGEWQWRTSANAPVLSTNAVFDEHRRRIVVLPDTATDGPYEWDGVQWYRLAHTAGPGPRVAAAMAWDRANRRVVVYGGSRSLAPLADAWSYDGMTWTLLSANAPPGPRSGAAMAFDPGTGDLVLHGGHASDATTWRLQGNAFVPMATSVTPGPRRGATLTFDGGGLLLTGGSVGNAATAWRLVGANWTSVGSFGVPQRDASFVTVRDRVRDVWLGFGGEGGGQPPGNSTLLFDGRWQVADPVHRPSPRGGALLAWSQVDGAILLWGGYDIHTQWQPETWLWNGNDWVQRPTAHSPPLSIRPVLAPDPTGGVMLFGAQTGPFAFTNEQWRWDGVDWQQLTAVAVPPAADYPAVAFDEVRNRVLVAARGSNQVREWDGVSWSVTTTPLTVVEPRFHWLHTVGRVVMIGVPYCWSWNGSGWDTLTLPFTTYAYRHLLPEPRTGRILGVRGVGGSSLGTIMTAVLTAQPAAMVAVGTGCGIDDIPRLTTIHEPRDGERGFALSVGALAASAPTLLAVGTDTVLTNLGRGCALFLDRPLATTFGLAGANGEFDQPLPIPTGLRGVQLFAQAAVLAPQQSPIGSVTLTGAVRITVGD